MEMETRAESIVLDQAENLSLWVSNLERSSNRKEIEVVRVKRRSGKLIAHDKRPCVIFATLQNCF